MTEHIPLGTGDGGGGGPPTGNAGGDLGSTYPNPTVTDLSIVGWTLDPATGALVVETNAVGATPLTLQADNASANILVLNDRNDFEVARFGQQGDFDLSAPSGSSASSVVNVITNEPTTDLAWFLSFGTSDPIRFAGADAWFVLPEPHDPPTTGDLNSGEIAMYVDNTGLAPAIKFLADTGETATVQLA